MCIRDRSNTDMGKKVGNSKLGIVFHTTYRGGESIGEMSASFGAGVKHLQGVKDVAVFSSEFTNVNGLANLSATERANVDRQITSAKRNLRTGARFLNSIQNESGTFAHNALFKIYFNQVIRGGKIPSTSQQMAKGFSMFVEDRYQKEIAKKKTAKSQKMWEERKDKSLKYLNTNRSVMFSALDGFKNLMDAKVLIINKLNKIEGVGTFIEDESGYRATAPEGFVAIKEGAALKLVDRLEFSRANFTVAKDWG